MKNKDSISTCENSIFYLVCVITILITPLILEKNKPSIEFIINFTGTYLTSIATLFLGIVAIKQNNTANKQNNTANKIQKDMSIIKDEEYMPKLVVEGLYGKHFFGNLINQTNKNFLTLELTLKKDEIKKKSNMSEFYDNCCINSLVINLLGKDDYKQNDISLCFYDLSLIYKSKMVIKDIVFNKISFLNNNIEIASESTKKISGQSLNRNLYYDQKFNFVISIIGDKNDTKTERKKSKDIITLKDKNTEFGKIIKADEIQITLDLISISNKTFRETIIVKKHMLSKLPNGEDNPDLTQVMISSSIKDVKPIKKYSS